MYPEVNISFYDHLLAGTSLPAIHPLQIWTSSILPLKILPKSKTAHSVSDVLSSTTLPLHAFCGWNTQARYIFITKKHRLQDYMHYMRYNLCFLDTKELKTYTFMTIYSPVHHYPHNIRYKYGLPAFYLYKVFQNEKRHILYQRF